MVLYFLGYFLFMLRIPLFKFSARDLAYFIGPKPFIFCILLKAKIYDLTVLWHRDCVLPHQVTKPFITSLLKGHVFEVFVSSEKVLNFEKAELYFFQVCEATAEEFSLLKSFFHLAFCIFGGRFLRKSFSSRKTAFEALFVLYLCALMLSKGVILGFLPFGFLSFSEAFLFLVSSGRLAGGST